MDRATLRNSTTALDTCLRQIVSRLQEGELDEAREIWRIEVEPMRRVVEEPFLPHSKLRPLFILIDQVLNPSSTFSLFSQEQGVQRVVDYHRHFHARDFLQARLHLSEILAFRTYHSDFDAERDSAPE